MIQSSKGNEWAVSARNGIIMGQERWVRKWDYNQVAIRKCFLLIDSVGTVALVESGSSATYKTPGWGKAPISGCLTPGLFSFPCPQPITTLLSTFLQTPRIFYPSFLSYPQSSSPLRLGYQVRCSLPQFSFLLFKKQEEAGFPWKGFTLIYHKKWMNK